MFIFHTKVASTEIYLASLTVFILITIQIIKVIIQRKLQNKFLKALIESLSGILFFIAGFSISKLVPSPLLKFVFEDFSILIGSVYLTRALYIAEEAATLPRFITFFFLTLAFITSVFTHFNFFNLDVKILLFLRKLFIILAFIPLITSLTSLLKESIRNIVSISLFISYLTFSILWLSGLITFDTKAIVGIGVIAVISLFYSWVITRGTEFIKNFIDKEFVRKRDIVVLIKNLKLLITLIFIFFLKISLEYFFNLDNLFYILKQTYFIKTELLKISFYNIIISIYYGFFLTSLLNVVRKGIKLYFPKHRRTIEGGSAEALIFNIGILFVFMVVLSSLGITWKVLLPIAGTLGVGIGFGLQTIMNNYMSGFILLFSKKLKIGDIVELPLSVPTLGNEEKNVFGKIEDIGILATLIRTNDGVEIAIPNSNFISSPIVNFSHHDPFVRLRIPVGVSYSSDPETVRKVLTKVLENMPGVLKTPRPKVWFWEFGESALIFIASFWIDIRKEIKIEEIRSRFYYTAWRELKKAGVEIPFPQHDLWFKNTLKVEIDSRKNPE
ncbi:mechanosensitive ion channel family protein [Desulfurobacterium atlanticum]|uniref:Mechanosensitive ion channel n=1 Tax=Desulfurobacterium atlanticum TaxID=240169 RepID=A0A238Y7Z3_9BACT|nr:mechanosensitive ion channel domain-containing protein [Desulfurobacterium atlanticum]SNR67345.1 Mechanosensitive ion channel [Desulfurobacterium atlanticum]